MVRYELYVETNIVSTYNLVMDRHSSPFGTRHRPPQQEAYVNLALGYVKRLSELNDLLRPYGLSEPQYNVLRILRGAGQQGLACQGISERMLTRLPDITRLLDRLEKSGLVERRHSLEDRRRVDVTLREEGKELLSRLDQQVFQLHSRQFQNLDPVELTELNRLLEKSLIDPDDEMNRRKSRIE